MFDAAGQGLQQAGHCSPSFQCTICCSMKRTLNAIRSMLRDAWCVVHIWMAQEFSTDVSLQTRPLDPLLISSLQNTLTALPLLYTGLRTFAAAVLDSPSVPRGKLAIMTTDPARPAPTVVYIARRQGVEMRLCTTLRGLSIWPSGVPLPFFHPFWHPLCYIDCLKVLTAFTSMNLPGHTWRAPQKAVAASICQHHRVQSAYTWHGRKGGATGGCCGSKAKLSYLVREADPIMRVQNMIRPGLAAAEL